ncbi:MAG: hypothetical protein H0X46_08475 [Bacteroidetes bacterium]|nr:hypothetical protein [Bacteroidota bacterium]
MSVGFFKVTKRERLEIGILYGNVPKKKGGQLHLLVLKGIYNPFRFQIGNKVMVEPLQTGVFVSQNFNENLKVRWGQSYPQGYYWWARSTRLHVFAGAQLSYQIEKKIDRIACYFEANTNTLYLSSYFPNRETMKPYDIIFFGLGGKIYF